MQGQTEKNINCKMPKGQQKFVQLRNDKWLFRLGIGNNEMVLLYEMNGKANSTCSSYFESKLVVRTLILLKRRMLNQSENEETIVVRAMNRRSNYSYKCILKEIL